MYPVLQHLIGNIAAFRFLGSETQILKAGNRQGPHLGVVFDNQHRLAIADALSFGRLRFICLYRRIGLSRHKSRKIETKARSVIHFAVKCDVPS